jgi:hypothetical protein
MEFKKNTNNIFIKDNKDSFINRKIKEKNIKLKYNIINKRKIIINPHKIQKYRNKLNIKFNFQKISLNLPLNTLPNDIKEKSYNSILSKIKHINKKTKEFEKKKEHYIVKEIFEPTKIKNYAINPNDTNKKFNFNDELPSKKLYNHGYENKIFIKNKLSNKIEFKNISKKCNDRNKSHQLHIHSENNKKNKILNKLLKEEFNINNKTIYYNYDKIIKKYSKNQNIDNNNQESIFNIINIKDFGMNEKIYKNKHFNSIIVPKFHLQNIIYKRRYKSKDNNDESNKCNKNIFPIIKK